LELGFSTTVTTDLRCTIAIRFITFRAFIDGGVSVAQLDGNTSFELLAVPASPLACDGLN